MIETPASERPKWATLPAAMSSDRAGYFLDRDIGVNAVLVEQVDALHVQPAQRVLDCRPDVLGAAVQPGRAAAVEGETELGSDHHPIADRAKAFPTSSSLLNVP
jgi:hypothetical protein